MPVIDRITANIGGKMLTVGATAAETDPIPWIDASSANPATGGGVRVPRDIRRDLERAGVRAAPPGKLLALAPLDTSLRTAGFDTSRIMQIKRSLVAAKQLDERQRS